MNRLISRISLPLLLVAFLVAGCGSDPAPEGDSSSSDAAAETTNASTPEVRTARVSVAVVERSTFEEIVPITGTLSAPNDAILSSQAAGTVTELAALGSRVAEGDVIARLDDRLIRAALEQARAGLASAESQARLAEDSFRRQEPLYQDSIISAIEYENVLSQRNQARAALNQAEAAVAQAEQQLEYTFIRAPFGGTVESREVERGEQVMPGSPIARVVNTQRLKVTAGVPEAYAAEIRRGSPVTVSVKALNSEPVQAQIAFAGSVVDPRSRTFSIEIELNNTSGDMKPAMIVDVFVTSRVLTEQVVIPQTSILRDENGSSVYLAVDSAEGTITERRPIELGPSYQGRTVITSGLEAGERVITTGQTLVAEGDLIEIAN